MKKSHIKSPPLYYEAEVRGHNTIDTGQIYLEPHFKVIVILYFSFLLKRKEQEDKRETKFDIMVKLDGVGPVDNRPSTDKLHHFVRKKKIKKRKKILHVTCDT